jgi:hypothetical protein
VADAVGVGVGVDAEVDIQVGDGLGMAVTEGIRVGSVVPADMACRACGFAAGVPTVAAVGEDMDAAAGATTMPARYAAVSSRAKLR